MAKKLKGVILSIEDVLINAGVINAGVFAEVTLLMAFLKKRNITPVLLSNRRWHITSNGVRTEAFDYFSQKFPELSIYSFQLDSAVPKKPSAASTEYVCKKMGWESNEVVLIGSSDDDMRTAINGGILFLRATWYATKTNYGFEFSTPKEIARFIDTLCLREHFWSHEIRQGAVEFYSLAPFSTMKAEYARYSEDGRAAAKNNAGHPDFWLSALVTSLYFTGVHKRIDFITAYPPHKSAVFEKLMDEDLMTFGKCFNKAYLHDLIVRHSTALKSQTARNQGKPLNHLNQLNTIRLKSKPTRNMKKPYVNSPLQPGKTVLLVDDICTKGYSFESARQFLLQRGMNVIMVAWLKTINTDYEVLRDLPAFDPFEANTFGSAPVTSRYGYNTYLVDPNASAELDQQLKGFLTWDWPK